MFLKKARNEKQDGGDKYKAHRCIFNLKYINYHIKCISAPVKKQKW